MVYIFIYMVYIYDIIWAFHILEMSSSQLTNSFFSEGRSTTNQILYVQEKVFKVFGRRLMCEFYVMLMDKRLSSLTRDHGV